MSQLVKNYYINRDTGKWATDTRFGLMMPNIKGIEVQHYITDENDIPYMLSYVPEYFEKVITIEIGELGEYKTEENQTVDSLINAYVQDNNLDMISYNERNVEEQVIDRETQEPTGKVITMTFFDITYKDYYILEESEGLKVLTQEEWDNEISVYDTRQKNKRYDLLRINRDQMLEYTDWIVIRAKETETNLTTDFKTWRKELRELPNSVEFPTSYPTLPNSLKDDAHLQKLMNSFNEVRNIHMINDPLPSPEPQEEELAVQ